MMEAGAHFLLLMSTLLLQTGNALDFYGHSISFLPPQRKIDGTVLVNFLSRENSRASCSSQVSYTCETGKCTSLDKGTAQQTDEDDTGQERWCQTEAQSGAVVLASTKSVSLNATGCCWVSNVGNKRNWSAQAQLDLGSRSDTHSINNCPVTATVAALRVPKNCFTRTRLLAHDPDGDRVKCRLIGNSATNFVLDEDKCTLTKSGDISTGVHVFEVMLEDYPSKNINVTYPDGTVVHLNASDARLNPLCRLKLLFSLEVLSSLPSCEVGHVQPMFLSRTPSHESLLYASMGQTIHIYAEAQAHHSSIHDFQISGPHNMTKTFEDKENGKAGVTLSWTPHHNDLYRHVPVCFTAETDESQSEMRCAVIVVTKSTITHGKADVTCEANRMAVALEKSSMPGIDINYLMLLDKSCSLTSNDTHIMGSMSFSTCGTKVEDKGDFIVFSNEIDSFELPTEVITRRRNIKIGFSCQFPKIISISTFFNLHKADYIFTESTFGSFGYTFEIYKDNKFTNKVEPNDYPVEVKLFDKIYMSIQAESDLQAVTLFVESCKATPDDNPDNSLSYDLIKDGCLKDETLVVKTSQDTTFNFEVQAFKFNGNYDQVYITCSVILCELDSAFSRCAQGCVQNPNSSKRRRRRGLSKETVDHRITQGPLRFVEDAIVPNGAVDEDGLEAIAMEGMDLVTTSAVNVKDLGVKRINTQPTVTLPLSPRPVSVTVDEGEDEDNWDLQEVRDMLSTNISTMVFASAFVISLVAMALLTCHFTRKKREEDRKLLLDTE